MSYYDYIKIEGLTTSVTGFYVECFQGMTAAADVTGIENALIQIRDYLERINASMWGDDVQLDAFSLALWQAQTAAITNESAYLAQLDDIFKEKKRVLGEKGSQMVEFMSEFIAGLVGPSISKWLVAIGASAGITSIVGVVSGFLIELGIGLAFDKLEKLLLEGHALIEAMIAENQILTSLSSDDRTAGLYDKREQVLLRHLQQIEIILKQIHEAERDVNEATSLQNLSNLEALFQQAFLIPKIKNGEVVTDDDGNIMYEGFLEDRLKDLAYQEESTEYPNGVRMHPSGKIIEYSG